MAENPLIRSVMTPFPHAIDVDEPVSVARKMMLQHHIRHLPVKEGDSLVGLITDRDIKLALGPYLNAPSDDGQILVRHVCIGEIHTVEMTTPLHLVVAEMARRRLGSTLITKDGRLAGIFTATDACRYLAELLGDESFSPPSGDDVA